MGYPHWMDNLIAFLASPKPVKTYYGRSGEDIYVDISADSNTLLVSKSFNFMARIGA